MTELIVYVPHPVDVAGSDGEGWRLEVPASRDAIEEMLAWMTATCVDLNALLGATPRERLGAGVEGDRVAT